MAEAGANERDLSGSRVPVERQLFLIALSAIAVLLAIALVHGAGAWPSLGLALSANLARIIVGVGAGFALSVSGAVLDGTGVRPLRELSVLLVSAGAAAGAALLPSALPIGPAAFVLGGVLGGGGGMLLGRLADGPERTRNLAAGALLLVAVVGLGVASGAAAADEGWRGRWLRWMMGDLSQATLLGGLLVFAATAVLFRLLEGAYRDLDVGTDARLALGSGVAGPSTIAALMWGVAVLAAGPIAMVALLVSLFTRRVLGPSQLRERLLFIGLVGGAALALFDAAQRWLIGGDVTGLNLPIAVFAFPLFLFWNARRLRETGRRPGNAYQLLEAALIVTVTLLLLTTGAQLIGLTRSIS